MNCITLASELRSDDNGVPVEWTLLKTGETSYTKEGIDGKLSFTEKDLAEIISYHKKKGEEIPVDSEHFLFALGAGKGIISIGIYDLTGEIKNTPSSRINKFLHLS